MQPPIFKLCGFLPEVFLTMAKDFPKRNNPCHPCVSASLPRDAAHNQKVSDYWLLQFLQYCKRLQKTWHHGLYRSSASSSNGAKASAILYSLVETAKANMINTFEYFNLLLTEIPQHMDDKDLRFIDDLLPWSPRVQKKCPSRYKKS